MNKKKLDDEIESNPKVKGRKLYFAWLFYSQKKIIFYFIKKSFNELNLNSYE